MLNVPLTKANKYCEESTAYQCISDWNNFKKEFPQIPENKLSNMKIKIILKQAISDQYWTFYSPPSTSICVPCIIFIVYHQGLFNWHHTFMILLVLIFIGNRIFELLDWHNISLLHSVISFVITICFLLRYFVLRYYCLCCCCPLIIIIITIILFLPITIITYSFVFYLVLLFYLSIYFVFLTCIYCTLYCIPF